MSQARVAIVKCGSYEEPVVSAAVASGLALLGGAGRFLRAGEKILLKPNVLWGTDPDRCVVTHPAVFKAVALALRAAGAILQYGDSPAGILTSAAAMKRPGFDTLAQELGIPLADFDKGRRVSFPGGVTSKQLHICNAVFDTDGLVSLPKLKTHDLTRMTGAVKNQFGCVPRMTKGEYHARFPSIFDFARLLVDITAFVRPRLYVMDAVMAMEGHGPRSGNPRHLGLLLLSSDPVALDTVACRIIDLDRSFVPTIRFGEEAGLGTSRDEEIEVVGERVETVVVRDFDVTRMMPVALPSGRMRRVKMLLTPRPVINRKLCTRCSQCVKSCPVDPKAVDWDPRHGREAPPVYNYNRCIRCYCCSEVCPSAAVKIKVPLLRKILPMVSFLSLLAARNHNQSASRR